MFILDEPYVSSLLLETVLKNGYEILENDFMKAEAATYNCNGFCGKFNFVSKKEALDVIENGKIYTNSENSINFIMENCPNSNFAKVISLCKDKFQFREALKPLYPDFFFEEISVEELDKIKFGNVGKPFIIKPAVGFLSLGVHKVRSKEEWERVKTEIRAEISEISKLFPKSVLNISKFIIEEIIEGEEFAIDVSYHSANEPVILNILKHPFLDGDDVSDRAYVTSAAIVKENITVFSGVLSNIGKAFVQNSLNVKNFPMHIELIKRKDGKIIPVEINPARFAGWCTTDLAYFAYGVNVYEYFENGKKPDWELISDKAGDKIFYFAIAERPKELQTGNFKFDYEALYQNFSNILEKREINYTEKPVYAILFGSTNNTGELNKILKLDMKSFVKGV